MRELVVDTSAWIQAFRGGMDLPLEEALKTGKVVLPPLVVAELLSGVKNPKDEKKLEKFLSYIPLHPVGRVHWKKVGLLRSFLKKKGFSVSIPDCHVAQCTLECDGLLLTYDRIFSKIADKIDLQLLPP